MNNKKSYNQYELSKKYILYQKTKYTFIVLNVVFLIGIIAFFNFFISILLLFFILTSYIYLFFFYCKKDFQNFIYHIDNKFIQINHGVYLKKNKFLNIKSIQYLEITKNPIEKKLSLCTIVFHISGGKISLPQLETSVAKNLYNQINIQIENRSDIKNESKKDF